MQLTPLWLCEHLRLEKTHSNNQIGVFIPEIFSWMMLQVTHIWILSMFPCFYGLFLQLESETPLNVVLGTVESHSTAIPCPHRSLYLGLLLPPLFFPSLEENWKLERKKGKGTPYLSDPQLKRRLVPKGKHICALEIFLELQKRGSNIESTNQMEPG